ncbi:MAG: hypothetical protein V1929_10405 [bacterium]
MIRPVGPMLDAGCLIAAFLLALPAAAQPPRESDGAGTPFLQTLAVQTFLDRQNLSCGCIDGVMGARTRAALDTWKERQGIPTAAQVNVAMMGSLASVFPCMWSVSMMRRGWLRCRAPGPAGRPSQTWDMKRSWKPLRRNTTPHRVRSGG